MRVVVPGFSRLRPFDKNGCLGVPDSRFLAGAAGLACLLLSASACPALDTGLASSVEKYRSRYPLTDPTKKLIGDWGKVPSDIAGVDAGALETDLKGVRNFRYVLDGLLYRGGKINPGDTPRYSSKQSMSKNGLENLCKQGFGTAIYLYNDPVLRSEPQDVTCETKDGKDNKLNYENLTPLVSTADAKAILTTVHAALTDGPHQPIYVHCWNGWHAPGYISALALRQFCGFSGDEAVKYWNVDTDGNCRGATRGRIQSGNSYDSIRSKIRAYQPGNFPELNISADVANAVCPSRDALDHYSDPCPNSVRPAASPRRRR
jgi:hypothetical protein